MPTSEIMKSGLAMIESDSSKLLGLKVGNHVVTPGLYIPRAEAQSVPELAYGALSTSQTYMVVGLDPDAPFPSFTILGPILHWIQPELKLTSEGTLKSSAPFVANYIGPAPPPGSSPHRYVFLLFEQPAGFDGGKYAPADGQRMGNGPRIRYNLDKWAKEVKIGTVLAANYFLSN